MPRAPWKGSISFGLVEIPVFLRPAVSSATLDLDYLDRRDFSPIGYQRVNKATGAVVPWDQMVRGYQYEKGEYVVLTPEEMKAANVEATQTIEILDFVDEDAIDPLYFETPYYVEPQKQGSRSYVLLRESLKKTGKLGIAQIVFRTRQHLAALAGRDEAMVLYLLRYHDEIRDLDELDLEKIEKKKAGVRESELRMAEQLIASMSSKWKPEKYRDEYRKDLLALIDKKVKAGKTKAVYIPESAQKRPRKSARIVDLMPLLKQSLAKTKTRKAPRSRHAKSA